jgi:hypothetical protein
VEAGDWRLWGRELADYRDRYPELHVLRRLPSGTVVDGELLVLRQGRPELNTLLRRHQLVNSVRVRQASVRRAREARTRPSPAQGDWQCFCADPAEVPARPATRSSPIGDTRNR